MRKRPAVVMGSLLVAALGAAAVVTLSLRTPEASAVIGEVTILDVITLVLRGAAPPES